MPRLDGAAAIDRLRDADGTLSRTALRLILPYGEDFLFLDRVTRLSSEDASATYCVPSGLSFLAAHFDDYPVMPAALVTEGCAQAGTLLVRYNLVAGQDKDIVALRIDSARFEAAVFPGTELQFALHLVRLRRGLARLDGIVGDGTRRLARIRMDLGIVDSRSFRSQGS